MLQAVVWTGDYDTVDISYVDTDAAVTSSAGQTEGRVLLVADAVGGQRTLQDPCRKL